MTAGEYLRACRVRSNLTLRALAKGLGFSAPFVCDVELDRRYVPRDCETRARWVGLIGADPAEVDRLASESSPVIDVRDLAPEDRARVAALAAELRQRRAA